MHEAYPSLAVFNGLGTKGVMLAPYYANALLNLLQNQIPLHKEISLQRMRRKLNEADEKFL